MPSEFEVFKKFIKNPAHPYSKGLLNSTPVPGSRKAQLEPILGQPPDLKNAVPGCQFAPRCAYCKERCLKEFPTVVNLSSTHSLYCWLLSEGGENNG